MGLLWRFGVWRTVVVLVVYLSLDRDGIDFAEPAAKVNVLAASTAKRHGVAGSRVELFFADGATDHA